MIEFNRQVRKARDMGEAYDQKLLCMSAKKVPGFTKLAREYFYACDPISAPREVAEFERLNVIADRYNKLRCTSQEQTTGRKRS